MTCVLRRFPRFAVFLASLAILGCQQSPTATAPDSLTPADSVAAWRRLIRPLEYPKKVTDDWFSVPVAVPGISAELAKVLRQDKSPTIRAHAARALGELAGEPAVAIPALCRAFADENESVRRQAIGAVRHFGSAAQDALWLLAKDFRPVLNPPDEGGPTPVLVSDYAVAALGGLPGLDPRPLFDEFRNAGHRGTWVDPTDRAGKTVSGKPPVFAGSTRHLAGVLEAIFQDPDPTTAAGLGEFLADPDERIRSLALAVVEKLPDTEAAVEPIRRRLALASADEKKQLIKVLRCGGKSAAPVLFSMLGPDGKDDIESDAIVAATRLLWGQPLSFLLSELARDHRPVVRVFLLQNLVAHLETSGLPADWQSAIGSVITKQLADPKTPASAVEILEGAVEIRDEFNRHHRSERDFSFRLPPAVAQPFASAIMDRYAASSPSEQGEALGALGALGPAARSDRALAFLGQILKGSDEEKREAAMLALTAMGAPSPELVTWRGSNEQEFQTISDLLDEKSTVGIAFLTEVVRRASERRSFESDHSLPALWRLVNSSSDPAQTARQLSSVTNSQGVQMAIAAILADKGNATEQQQFRKQLSPDWVAPTLDADDTPTAAILARLGDTSVKDKFLEVLDGYPAARRAVREALQRGDDAYPWEEKLLRALPKMNNHGFEVAQSLLLTTRTGRAGLEKIVAPVVIEAAAASRTAESQQPKPKPKHLAKVLEQIGALGLKSPAVVKALQQIAEDQAWDESRLALTALAHLAPEAPRTRAAWIAALGSDDKEVRKAALAAIEKALGVVPELHPLWLAASMRERESVESPLSTTLNRVAEAFADWKRSVTPPPPPIAPKPVSVAVQPTLSTDNLRLLLDSLVREVTANPSRAAQIAREAAVANPAHAVVIAVAVATAAPDQAARIAAAVVSAMPATTAAVASAVSNTAPSQAAAIASAVTAAAPTQVVVLDSFVATSAPMATPEGVEFQKFLFPWPPPPPVCWDTFRDSPGPLNRRWLGNDDTPLDDVNNRLRAALNAVSPGYSSGLFPVPGGFALVTRIERFDRRGAPLPGDLRWPEGDSLKANFPDWMFYEKPGYFRKIVFAITTDLNIRFQVGRAIPEPESGAKNLPAELGQLTLKGRHIHVLVYAFEKIPGGKFVPFRALTAPQHVGHTGLLEYLKAPLSP
jgi:hypothetical protein